MKLYWIIFIFIGALSSCDTHEDHEHHQADEKEHGESIVLTKGQIRSTGIEIGKFEQKNLEKMVRATGRLDLPPQKQATVSCHIGGVIKNIQIIQGDLVKAGQTLALLEHPDIVQLQEDYLKALGTFSFLEKEYQRQKELYDEKVAAEKKFQETEAEYKNQKALIRSLENKLRIINISPEGVAEGDISGTAPIQAPIGGYINKINVNTGSFVNPGVEIFSIVDLSHIHVDLDVFEKDIDLIKKGQKIIFTVSESGSREYEAEIFSVGKALEEHSKTVPVHADIKNNKNPGLLPGRYVNARIEVGEGLVQVLPKEALVSQGELHYIFVKESQDSASVSFNAVEVKTGVADQNDVEVIPIEKLPPDAAIVIKGAYYLMAQMQKDQGGSEEGGHGH